MKTRTFYRVNVNDAGNNFECPEFDTYEEAEAEYNRILSRLENSEHFHKEDNTDEWLYLEFEKITVNDDCEPDEVDYIIDSEILRTSDYYYREALL